MKKTKKGSEQYDFLLTIKHLIIQIVVVSKINHLHEETIMNYRVVKQFWVNTVDNFFNFFYKIVDFIKIWADVFWAFLDIWYHFFAIFGNLFLYIYYIFLFIIDRTTESGTNIVLTSRLPKRVPFKPQKAYVKDSYNPIPAMYRVKTVTSDAGKAVASSVQSAASTASSVASSASNTISQTLKPLKPAPVGTGSKMSIKSIAKDSAEFLLDIFKTLKDFIIKPIKAIAEFLSTKLMPVKESDVKFNQAMQKRSLIDEYLKEYEKKQKKRR